jgi:hypothetical protein
MFVLSNSAQSLALMNVLTNHPGLYKGAIFLVPSGGFGNPSDLEAGWKPFKILVSTQDGRDRGLESFQAGVEVGHGYELYRSPGNAARIHCQTIAKGTHPGDAPHNL